MDDLLSAQLVVVRNCEIGLRGDDSLDLAFGARHARDLSRLTGCAAYFGRRLFGRLATRPANRARSALDVARGARPRRIVGVLTLDLGGEDVVGERRDRLAHLRQRALLIRADARRQFRRRFITELAGELFDRVVHRDLHCFACALVAGVANELLGAAVTSDEVERRLREGKRLADQRLRHGDADLGQ